MAGNILAIDQGTTSTRAIVFDRAGRRPRAPSASSTSIPAGRLGRARSREDLAGHAGRLREVLARGRVDAAEIAAIGITNQRETTVLWERATGRPIHRAIVWQDRRTADRCATLVRPATRPVGRAHRAGDRPLFLRDQARLAPRRRAGRAGAAERGELAFGTIDSFLLWRLTGGGVHATDATNASRTMLFDIHRQDWDDELLRLLKSRARCCPRSRLRRASARPAGCSAAAADQRHRGRPAGRDLRPGLLPAGHDQEHLRHRLLRAPEHRCSPVASRNRLLTTVAWRLGGKTTYALEGSIFVAGAAVQWLRDGLKLIASAAESETLAARIDEPAASTWCRRSPGWARRTGIRTHAGRSSGLTRDTGIAEIVRATLEAVGFQTRDLLRCMRRPRPRGRRAARRWRHGRQ